MITDPALRSFQFADAGTCPGASVRVNPPRAGVFVEEANKVQKGSKRKKGPREVQKGPREKGRRGIAK
jgi:hypothetical protein